MSGDIIHSVLEGLDSSQSKGGLIIRKKPKGGGAEEQVEGGFKLPSGPSLLGLDKLAAVKERERKLKEAENAKKRQLEQEEAGEEKSDKFVRKDEGRERQIREPRVETPTHTGGVSEEARRREEERGRGDRGLRVENRRDRDSGYYDREWRRDPVREDRHRR